MGKTIVTPEGQSATFVELFFDLVFVFAITQMVGLLHHDLSWAGAGRAVLVFWMVWWAWTQFTWALNAADTTHLFVELMTLAGTALAFFLAVAVPDAFGAGSLWFAVTYVAVRVVGLTLYSIVALHTPGLGAAVRNFAMLSVGGLACAIVGGVLGGEAQLWLWGLTILLDFVAAGAAGNNDWWSLNAAHFAERHGLIVIIALGESLIVAASTLAGTSEWELGVLLVAALAVLVSCGLWWTYFPVAMPRMEHGLATSQGAAQATMARDAYSLGHFPMLCGVIAYAVALEEVLAHPHDPLGIAGRLLIAAGLLLFLCGPVFGLWRTTGHGSLARLLIAVGSAGAVFALSGVAPAVTLATALAGVTAVAVLDERRAARTKAADA